MRRLRSARRGAPRGRRALLAAALAVAAVVSVAALVVASPSDPAPTPVPVAASEFDPAVAASPLCRAHLAWEEAFGLVLDPHPNSSAVPDPGQAQAALAATWDAFSGIEIAADEDLAELAAAYRAVVEPASEAVVAAATAGGGLPAAAEEDARTDSLWRPLRYWTASVLAAGEGPAAELFEVTAAFEAEAVRRCAPGRFLDPLLEDPSLSPGPAAPRGR